jgi:predicted phosphodiesterase
MSVVAIPGNHGENRQNGKSITSVHDNDDVAVFEQVAEILAMNHESFSHVGFRLSRDEIALGIEVSGKILAVTHGHVTKPGANAAQTLWNWWQGQAMGRAYPVVADADILISGHYHHLNIKEQENRAVFVCPSLTQVGEYFSDSTGVKTRSGTLSMLISPDGWGELTLL